VQDFRVALSYGPYLRKKIPNLKFDDFDHDGVKGVGLMGLSWGMAFNTLNLLVLSQFLAHACMLVFIAILTLRLGFPHHGLHFFCIWSATTAVF
jgi:hypothetical protein